MKIDTRSAEAREWRRLYRTQRWISLRKQALARDLYLCQECKRRVYTGKQYAKHPQFANVHHLLAHKGDTVLFYDLDNLVTTCQGCHSRHIQSLERIGYSTRIAEDGWPSDPKHPANRKP